MKRQNGDSSEFSGKVLEQEPNENKRIKLVENCSNKNLTEIQSVNELTETNTREMSSETPSLFYNNKETQLLDKENQKEIPENSLLIEYQIVDKLSIDNNVQTSCHCSSAISQNTNFSQDEFISSKENEKILNSEDMDKCRESISQHDKELIFPYVFKEQQLAHILNDNETNLLCTSNITDLHSNDLPLKLNFDIENLATSLIHITKLEGHANEIYAVAADENIILSSSADTTIKVWKVEEKQEISNFSGHTDSITSLILLTLDQSQVLSSHLSYKNAKIALSASLDCHIKIWAILDGKELKSIYTFNGITCLGYLEAKMYVAIATEGGKLEIWDIINATLIDSIKNAHDDYISDLKIDNMQLYTCSWDGAVKVWSFDDNELIPMYVRRRKELSDNKVDFYPSHWNSLAVYNRILYLGDNTSDLKVLNFETARLKLIKNHLENEGIIDAIFVKENILLSTYFDTKMKTGGINVWKLPDLAYICTLSGNIQKVNCLAITITQERKLRIISGGDYLLIWDIDFSQPAKFEDDYFIREIETIGEERKNENVTKPEISFVNIAQTETKQNSLLKKPSWCTMM